MSNYIIVGCDLHDESIVLKIAHNCEQPDTRTIANTMTGRRKLIELLKKRAVTAGNAKVVVAYEASSQGFGLYDDMTDAGFECSVLAPTRMERSAKEKRSKSDDKDAERVLQILRGHLLAGNKLPAIWIPDMETRDDRELVRARLDIGNKITALKTQIQTLLKRTRRDQLPKVIKAWTTPFRTWLERLATNENGLRTGARATLGTMLRQLKMLETEKITLDLSVQKLAETARYENSCK